MHRNVAFVITLIRGILAVSLGAALLFQPDKTGSMLANFMGMFWLVSGIFSLRWGAAGERARGWALLAGIIGVIKLADHVIDLGPEGGEGGGEIVVAGTPEEVAREPRSYTGRALAPALSS